MTKTVVVELEVLNRNLGTLLSKRTARTVAADNVEYVGDLIIRTERELLRIPHFGRAKLKEVRGKLAELGLCLGMDVPAEWYDRIRWELDTDETSTL
jgi:DNA-directed RNA polymerase alpha subunit